MEENKQDRRVKYTKMVIKETFVKLLKQKSILKISVKELCENADINRATFYSHYSDQYDLLVQIESEVVSDIKKYLNDYDYKDIKLIPVEMIDKILQYVKNDAELFGILLNSNNDMKFQQEVMQIIGTYFIPKIENTSLNIKNAEYIFCYLASGSLSIIQMWLKEGMKKPSKEIASLIMEISINGSRNLYS